MGEEIKVDYGGLKRVHTQIEAARTALDELVLSLPDGSCNSEAVTEFKARTDDLRNLIVRYKNLLRADSENLKKAAESFQKKDSAMAKRYHEGVSKSLYGHS